MRRAISGMMGPGTNPAPPLGTLLEECSDHHLHCSAATIAEVQVYGRHQSSTPYVLSYYAAVQTRTIVFQEMTAHDAAIGSDGHAINGGSNSSCSTTTAKAEANRLAQAVLNWACTFFSPSSRPQMPCLALRWSRYRRESA